MPDIPPVIITGGSVTVEVDETQLPRDSNGKFKNDNKKIKRIEIVGDYNKDTGEVQNGKVTIYIHCV